MVLFIWTAAALVSAFGTMTPMINSEKPQTQATMRQILAIYAILSLITYFGAEFFWTKSQEVSVLIGVSFLVISIALPWIAVVNSRKEWDANLKISSEGGMQS